MYNLEKGKKYMKKDKKDDTMDYDLEKKSCIMVQGTLGNFEKLINFNNEEKKIMLDFLKKLEDIGIEFFGTSYKKELLLELDGIFSHVDKTVSFDFDSFKKMILDNNLTFEGKYALATYNPDEDDLNFEIKDK